MIKISVIIPNYNNGKYIEKCINSVIAQTLKEIEIIVIDDGSTDDSDLIMQKFQKQDKRIKYIKQFNMNAAVARNKGLSISTGKYVFFLDSDDYISDNDVLLKMYNDIKGKDLLIANYKVIDNMDSIIKQYNIKQDELLDINSVYKYTIISPVPSNKLYDNSIIKNNDLYFANIRIGQDLNFYLKYLSLCKNIIIKDYNTYNYRINNEGVSKKCNFNLFDIVNCFDDVEKKYIKLNKKEDYLSYVQIAKLKHYYLQMNKYKNNYSRKEKKLIFNYFNVFFRKINFKKIDRDAYFYYYYRRLMIKYRLRFFLFIINK